MTNLRELGLVLVVEGGLDPHLRQNSREGECTDAISVVGEGPMWVGLAATDYANSRGAECAVGIGPVCLRAARATIGKASKHLPGTRRCSCTSRPHPSRRPPRLTCSRMHPHACTVAE